MVPAPDWHYQVEYTFDRPSEPEKWKETEGLRASFGTTNELYLRCELPGESRLSGEWECSAWRGERLNAQLLVWSAGPQEQVGISISDLVGPQGQVIPAADVRKRLVRYVLSNFPSGAGSFGCDVDQESAWLMPDRLEEFKRFDLPEMTVRPVWLTLDIDPSTVPGLYTGRVEVSSITESRSLEIRIRVLEQCLPDPVDWTFRLDLWQNPWAVCGYFGVKPWSESHEQLLREHLREYAQAGGKYITTYAVHSPWSDNSYRLEEAMIEWIRTPDLKWSFDFSPLDRYVKLAMEEGIQGAITVYTPLPWGNRFRYLDASTGKYRYEEWSPHSEEYSSAWNIFLDHLKEHMDAMGWLDRTYLGINENEMEQTLKAIDVIKNHSPDWKITYAGNWHDELSPLLDDYSVIIGDVPGEKKIRERAEKGQTTTFYVCCNPPRPNNFVFSPPVEGRSLGWFAARHNLDGFLRWAYDAWPADPLRDARHTLWPAGDCFLVYPGGAGSIRMEKLREGVVDYEKIRIAGQLIEEVKDKDADQLWKEFQSVLSAMNPIYMAEEETYDPLRLEEKIVEGLQIIDRIIETIER